MCIHECHNYKYNYDYFFNCANGMDIKLLPGSSFTTLHSSLVTSAIS